jgi:acetylornithine/succinyldiaminopimelate/putrescine aminotransferase
MDHTQKLKQISSSNSQPKDTIGLPESIIRTFLSRDPQLGVAIDAAFAAHQELKREFPEFFTMAETEQIKALQHGFLNFYDFYAVNPFVPIAAKGPWIVTSFGAVVHDSGGYGMLGFGHNPDAIHQALAKPYVMANIMTASFSQRRLIQRLQKEIGHRRSSAKRQPFSRFVCLNSGSEAMTAALRISDINAKIQTDPGGRHQGKKIMLLSNRGSFHGRTERPAVASHSSQKKYQQALASFRDNNRLMLVEPNNTQALADVFVQAERDGIFIEALLIEPVMGEGNPGVAMTPEFYRLARQLTLAHGSMLIADSIQAGLRTTGALSIVDYPGFEELDPPDMESYSKALNAGQYPLSVLAMTDRAANLYKVGVYGNTMTANPRALEVACAVLDGLTPAVRSNIQERGREFVTKIKALAQDLKGAITDVQGTGLLFSAHLDPKKFLALGKDSTEIWLRTRGIGVIHGGENALRFTPHFNITSAEIDMILDFLRLSLTEGPRVR